MLRIIPLRFNPDYPKIRVILFKALTTTNYLWELIMETLKQSAITAISQLPDTANIDDIMVILYQMKSEVRNQTATETKPVSCYDLAKDYCVEDAPKELSTNANAKEEIRTRTVWRKPSAKIAGKGQILGDIMTPVRTPYTS